MLSCHLPNCYKASRYSLFLAYNNTKILIAIFTQIRAKEKREYRIYVNVMRVETRLIRGLIHTMLMPRALTGRPDSPRY